MHQRGKIEMDTGKGIIYILFTVFLTTFVMACRPRPGHAVSAQPEQPAALITLDAEHTSHAATPPVLTPAFRLSMQAEVEAFLDCSAPEASAGLAAGIYQDMEQAMAGRAPAEVDTMLASLAGGLVALAEAHVPQISAALLTAAGPQRQDLVLAAIAAVQTEARADEVAQAAATVFATEDAVRVQSIVAHPSDYLEPPMLEAVTQAATTFRLLREARAAGEHALFTDRDGGTPPAHRSEASSATEGEL
jgi:hypothetical protein